jgi:hypothetical protein
VQRVEQARGALVANAEALTTGGLANGTREERLPRAGRAEYDGIEVTRDPLRLSQFEHAAPVEATTGREAQVFQEGRQGEVCGLHTATQTAVGAAGALYVEQ